jgi:hypothetical protein
VGLILSIIRHSCLIGVVLLYSVFAQADEWIIEDDDTHITLKKNGEIAHGNNIYFNFDKDNGCLINVFFFMYTMQDNIPSLMELYEDQAFQVILGGEEIPANLSYSTPFGLGQIAGIYIGREMPLSKGFISYNKQLLQDNFMMMEIPEPHAQYFDIPMEHWDFTNIETKLHEAHNVCIAKQI